MPGTSGSSGGNRLSWSVLAARSRSRYSRAFSIARAIRRVTSRANARSSSSSTSIDGSCTTSAPHVVPAIVSGRAIPTPGIGTGTCRSVATAAARSSAPERRSPGRGFQRDRDEGMPLPHEQRRLRSHVVDREPHRRPRGRVVVERQGEGARRGRQGVEPGSSPRRAFARSRTIDRLRALLPDRAEQRQIASAEVGAGWIRRREGADHRPAEQQGQADERMIALLASAGSAGYDDPAPPWSRRRPVRRRGWRRHIRSGSVTEALPIRPIVRLVASPRTRRGRTIRTPTVAAPAPAGRSSAPTSRRAPPPPTWHVRTRP